MEAFLTHVAKKLIQSEKPLASLKIVLPSQRASRFLRQAIMESLEIPSLSPEIHSITEFVGELSGLQKLAPHQLLLRCYESYCAVVPVKQQDNFEQFLNWAPVMLQDFNDLCAHRVPQDQIFRYLTEVETLKQWAQKDQQTPLVKNYIQFWKQLPDLFRHFTEGLLHDKLGFLGLLFSESVENLSLYLEHTEQYHYLIGFNALTQSEALLFQEIISQQRGQVLWDIDPVFYEHSSHASGYFIRRYFQEWKSLRGKKPQWQKSTFAEKKSIQCIASDHSISQVKYAAQLAQQLTQAYPEEKIALVLGDESYLVPTLSGFETSFQDWNVTMGYSLIQTPAADLFIQWLDCLEALESDRLRLDALEKLMHSAFFHHYLSPLGISVKEPLERAIKRNQTFLNRSQLLAWFDHSDWQFLFAPFQNATELLMRMRLLSIELQAFFYKTQPNPNYESNFYALEVILNQLLDTTSATDILDSLSLVKTFFKDLLQRETQDLEGDATKGLQIMGLLETRLLDFDRVIVTHLNEGQLPAGKVSNSFLPFEVKKEFGVPTYQEKDAIFTYHFYRLLQRSHDIYLLYNATQEGLGGGAPSRFIYQLEHFCQPAHQFQKAQLQAEYTAADSAEHEIQKSPLLLQRLQEIATQGFSPSALTLYLRDPIVFYEERVLGISTLKEAEAIVSHRDQGTILHAVLETLFTPYVNKKLSEKDYITMQSQLLDCLRAHFKEVYGRDSAFQGKNHLIFEVLRAHCERFLNYEKALVASGNTLEVLALEDRFSMEIPLPGFDFPIHLRGTIDRIDVLNGQVRIIDYKTGNVATNALKLDPTALDFEDPKTAVAFQVLTYAYQYLQQKPEAEVQAGVYALKAKKTFAPLGWGKSSETILTLEKIQPFEALLHDLITEILSPNKSFLQNKKGN
jgi:ATP-dependent helicase/nuclease subunit B